ncbi:MAG: hypothetical protein ACRD19_10270 [Terriglobia bacterium]
MPNKTYRIKLVRGDVHFEAEGDKAFVLQMLARFEAPTPAKERPAPAFASLRGGKGGTTPEFTTVSRSTSPGEFIRQFHFKKQTDFVLAFGYYLEKHSGVKEFAAADINNCYYEAKMESSNTSQMIIQNIRRGYLMDAKGAGKKTKVARKLFTLTRSGEEYLQKALAGEGDE